MVSQIRASAPRVLATAPMVRLWLISVVLLGLPSVSPGDESVVGTSRFARPPRDDRYAGYYVGGSRPFFGEGRDSTTEGTWGWDYSGFLIPKRIALQWNHGARKPAPRGTYATERHPRSAR